jgi:hypothetical protein
MKNIIKKLLIVVLAITATTTQLDAMKLTKNQDTQGSVLHVDKEVSILDQILDQAFIILENASSAHSAATKRLHKLLKKLDPAIQKVINNDCATITKTTTATDAKVHAFNQLSATITNIKLKADLVDIAQEAAQVIADAPDALKQKVIPQQILKVKEAEEEIQQQGMLNRLKGRIFGDEVSWAKTAFYATVGAATIASIYYGYQYWEDITKTGKNAWMFATTPFTSIESAKKSVTAATIEHMYARGELQKALMKQQDNPNNLHSNQAVNALRDQLNTAQEKLHIATEQFRRVKWLRNPFNTIVNE